MSKGKFASLSYSIKLSLKDVLKCCKWRMILTSIFALIGCGVGIYFAFSSLPETYLDESRLLGFFTGNMTDLSSFLYRLLSSLFVVFLLWLFSKNKWLTPFAMILLFYRAYLLGINLGILLRFYSLSGIFVAIIIVLPLQLLLLEFFIFFFYALKCYENVMFCQNINNFILISLLIVLFINLVLVLLLLIFSPNVIFVL